MIWSSSFDIQMCWRGFDNFEKVYEKIVLNWFEQYLNQYLLNRIIQLATVCTSPLLIPGFHFVYLYCFYVYSGDIFVWISHTGTSLASAYTSVVTIKLIIINKTRVTKFSICYMYVIWIILWLYIFVLLIKMCLRLFFVCVCDSDLFNLFSNDISILRYQ